MEGEEVEVGRSEGGSGGGEGVRGDSVPGSAVVKSGTDVTEDTTQLGQTSRYVMHMHMFGMLGRGWGMVSKCWYGLPFLFL